ncbi:uncharacterized protein LOC119163786 [Rhipicephalus microplus]|uniref:uncharacterized protein LOC119163786 n=1 Tax=Rhipicephalus microplus TaxID=6941 RepID=UPI003F6BC4CE
MKTTACKPRVPSSYKKVKIKSSLSSACHEEYHSLVSVQGGLHSCLMCSYATKVKGHMQVHLRKHTGERPFQCHLCPAAFSLRATLVDHIRTHTGERPFSCDRCSASFALKKTLVKHMRTHTRERPFSFSSSLASLKQYRSLKPHKEDCISASSAHMLASTRCEDLCPPGQALPLSATSV